MNFTLTLPEPPKLQKEVDGMPLDLIIDGLRRRMKQNGTESMKAVERFYKEIDKDGNGRLSIEEFETGLMEHNILRSRAECDAIFRFFDVDQSGFIDYNEFMTVVKGELSERRKKVVHEAFNSLDVSGDGKLSAEDIRQRYRTFAHPDVRAGVRTEEEVFSEFLNHFDTIQADCEISLTEFEKYYETLSAMVGNDDLFETMVRNTWHLPGAHGGHCLRVHITKGNRPGSPGPWGNLYQKTVEIRPDIGLQRHDPGFFEKCKERLEELGWFDVAHIEVLGRY